jgi:hypothetical protein
LKPPREAAVARHDLSVRTFGGTRTGNESRVAGTIKNVGAADYPGGRVVCAHPAALVSAGMSPGPVWIPPLRPGQTWRTPTFAAPAGAGKETRFYVQIGEHEEDANAANDAKWATVTTPR